MLITRIWKKQPGKYFFLSTKSAAGRWKDIAFSRDEFDQVEDFIEENRDKNIYFCPHGFSKRQRLEQNAVLPKLFWADLDEADPEEIAIRPTIAIESSPGRFVGLWLVDQAIPGKQLNRRLTYFIGADHGGWDLTQVLRVPGTTNYKYQSTPRVRTLWIDGPEYTIKEIERKLPDDEEEEEEDGDALIVYRKYEKLLPPNIRRELLNGKPTPGKRSEMLWKMQQTLLEVGATTEECFTILRASPWNKFSDKQLRKEIERGGRNKFKAKPSAIKAGNDYKFLRHALDEVEEENIDWLWYPYMARGELSILEGDPGVGKSYLAQMVCMHIVDGDRLPSVKRLPIAKGKIAYFDMENSAGSVTKKRLKHNGCENFADYYQEEEPFSIDNEDKVGEVEEAIERIKPLVVVFDTLNTYIGKADVHNSAEAQQAFGWFKRLAKQFNCSVVVLRHLTKGSRDGKALYRGQGSIAFAGLARVVMSVGLMPDDPDTRVMAVTKINVTRPPKALTYTITELPDTLQESDRSKFEWGEFTDISADELIAAPPKVDRADELTDAKKFLSEMLLKGGVEAKKIERAAETRSISQRTLYRAADALGVKKATKGFGKDKCSMWSLPEEHP